MGQDREGFSFVMFLGKSVEIFFGRLIAFDKEHGCFAESPFEVSVADFLAACAVFFPVGFFGTLDQTSIGDKVLNSFEPFDVLNFIEHDKSKDFSYSWNRF